MSSISYEDQFINIINGFIVLFEDIIKTAYKAGYTTLNPEVLKIGNIVLNEKIKKLGHAHVLHSFIRHTHEHWKYVAESDEKHFSKNLHKIVKEVPQEYTLEFCRLFMGTDKKGKSLIPQEDKDAFFENATSLIKISIKYIYKKRDPKVHEDGKIEYQTNFFGKEISLSKYSKMFDVKL